MEFVRNLTAFKIHEIMVGLNLEIESLPVLVRVIGCDKQSADTVLEVNSLGYDGISAEINSDSNDITPADSDLMVIILGNPESGRVISLAKTFFDAHVLTIVILNRDEKIPLDCIDACTVVEQGKEIEIIKSLVEPIFMECRISFDLEELKFTLGKMKHFLILSGIGQGKNRVADAITQAMSGGRFNMVSEIERLSFLLYYNGNDCQPLTMEEMNSFSEFMKSLPESMEVVWGLFRDESIETDQVRLSIIAAGRNLKFDNQL